MCVLARPGPTRCQVEVVIGEVDTLTFEGAVSATLPQMPNCIRRTVGTSLDSSEGVCRIRSVCLGPSVALGGAPRTRGASLFATERTVMTRNCRICGAELRPLGGTALVYCIADGCGAVFMVRPGVGLSGATKCLEDRIGDLERERARAFEEEAWVKGVSPPGD